METNGSQNYLSPEVLASISGLEYKARLIVEGFLTGAHRSPYRGFSAEFAQHREYVPGDDLRHLDWKVWGRTDRLYVKQYDAETNFDCLITLDCSASMGFSSAPLSKAEYGKHVAAALAHLILLQRDSVGLCIVSQNETNLAPSSSTARIKELIHLLENAEPTGASSIGKALSGLSERSGRRKVIVVISDFLDEEQSLLHGLRLLHRSRHDVLLVHLLDPAEVTFPFNDMTSFQGLENEGTLKIQPGRLRVAYLQELKRHVSMVRNAARELKMDYLPMVTSQSLGEILSAYLVTRRARK
ncbi:MAG: DUF58 domain-containing protein [Planctomycetota bacterium]